MHVGPRKCSFNKFGSKNSKLVHKCTTSKNYSCCTNAPRFAQIGALQKKCSHNFSPKVHSGPKSALTTCSAPILNPDENSVFSAVYSPYLHQIRWPSMKSVSCFSSNYYIRSIWAKMVNPYMHSLTMNIKKLSQEIPEGSQMNPGRIPQGPRKDSGETLEKSQKI